MLKRDEFEFMQGAMQVGYTADRRAVWQLDGRLFEVIYDAKHTSLTKHLLTDCAWLEGKGGCIERGVRSVLLVVRPGETAQESLGILVDPQGHDYARYVGFYVDTSNNRFLVTNPPNLLAMPDIMGTTLAGKTFSQRVLEQSQASPSPGTTSKPKPSGRKPEEMPN
jgi:hypothetical protein